MREYFDILRECSLFRGIEQQELAKALDCLNARISSFAKGGAVLREGDPANYVGIVLTGRLQIVRTDFFGNRSILAQLAPGELFGESFACAGVKETAARLCQDQIDFSGPGKPSMTILSLSI